MTRYSNFKLGLMAVLGLMVFMSLPAEAQSARERATIYTPEGASVYEEFGFAAAIEIDGVIYVSGVVSRLVGEGTYEEQYGRGFARALERIGAILELAGASLDDVVKITSFHTDLARQGATALRVKKEVMGAEGPHPAWTAVGTPTLFGGFGQTEIEVIAHLPTRD